MQHWNTLVSLQSCLIVGLVDVCTAEELLNGASRGGVYYHDWCGHYWPVERWSLLIGNLWSPSSANIFPRTDAPHLRYEKNIHHTDEFKWNLKIAQSKVALGLISNTVVCLYFFHDIVCGALPWTVERNARNGFVMWKRRGRWWAKHPDTLRWKH